MQFKVSTLLSIVLATQALAAYVPSEPWSTLTPDESYLSGAITDYSSSFGIAIKTIATTTSSLAKRAVTQVSDGQIQAATTTSSISTKITSKTTEAAVTQITDGQIQAATSTTSKTTEAAVTQIGDGQIQAATTTTSKTTSKTTEAAVTQIGDGQIQAATTTTSKASTTAKTTEAAITQIGDGQIQAGTTTAKSTEAAVSQIGDGQIQAATTSKTTEAAASQVSDGQVQAATATGAAEVSDGQVTTVDGEEVDDPVTAVSCSSDGTLSMTLNSSILTDSSGRIGSIVANRQFQFDGPPPQAGAIYAAGWSITSEGNLAIGNNTVFYECLSGSFYNLYDEDIGSVCYPVHLSVVDLVDC